MEKMITRKETLVVAIIITGGFVTILNQTVMSPALPSIMEEFNITPAIGQWLTSVFLLVNGLMIPITAYLFERFTTRQLFIATMLIFIIGSTVAFFSVNFPMLLAARMLQATGAGIQIPFVSVMVMKIFPKSRRGFALGIAGIVIGFGPTIGPTMSGWVTDTWGWRYVFGSIAPIAMIIMILALIFLKNIGETHKIKLDWLSLLFSTFGFGGLLFGFSSAGSYGWIHYFTIIPIVVGGVCVFFFIRRQLKEEQPLLNLKLLKNPIFSTSTILSMVVNSGLMVAAVITPIFIQNILGKSAMLSGLILMPAAIMMVAMSPVTGLLFDKFGPRFLTITGLSIMAAGTCMLSFLSINTTTIYLTVAYTFRMIGIALVNMPLNTWGINALSSDMIAHGNAINNTARQVSGSIGTAILITVMMIVGQMLGSPDGQVTVSGINAAFMGTTILTVTALILAIIKVGTKKRDKKEKES